MANNHPQKTQDSENPSTNYHHQQNETSVFSCKPTRQQNTSVPQSTERPCLSHSESTETTQDSCLQGSSDRQYYPQNTSYIPPYNPQHPDNH